MPGTVIGGRKAAAKNKQYYGEDFYARIGAIGGKKSRKGGFGSQTIGKDGLTGSQRASIAGRIGGLKSRRKKKLPHMPTKGMTFGAELS